MSNTDTTYLHGHHESVLRSHSWRTAANSAAYLLKYLNPNMYILDIGCGPGTITADFAALVPNGKVLGIEYDSGVLDQARANAAKLGLKNIEYGTGDVHALNFPDGTFDVVHAHQVLQHLRDPIKAFSEMRRVTKPGGIVAIREGEVATFTVYPSSKDLEDFKSVYVRAGEKIGSTPKAGRHLVAWAKKAGFERKDITATASAWCFNTAEDRAWWGGMWADRILKSSFLDSVVNNQIATKDDLERYSKAWVNWKEDEDGWLSMIHSEVICRVV